MGLVCVGKRGYLFLVSWNLSAFSGEKMEFQGRKNFCFNLKMSTFLDKKM